MKEFEDGIDVRADSESSSAAHLETRRLYSNVLMVVVFCSLLTASGPAQWTPAVNAIKLPDSLVFVTAGTVTNTSLVWHPVAQRYYSVRVGNVGFPLETWLPTGGLSIAQTTAGVDTRGMWYNPATAQVERNCFATVGWASMEVDGSLNATNTFTVLLTGQLQPTAQSMGVLEPATNSVLFYSAGNLQVRSRATGLVVQTLPLTGTPLTSVSADCLIYTGQLGYEIGLLDYVNKRVLLFSRATGAFSGMSQLPATAVTAAAYRLGYTNDRFWLFNSATKTWNAYCIWTQQCSMILPVELIGWSARCDGGKAHLSWTTASEHNSSHFALERSTDAVKWEALGEVPAAGYSQQIIEYTLTDAQVPSGAVVYYRLRQVDLDGREEVFAALSVERCDEEQVKLAVLPNPTDGWVTIGWHAVQESGPVSALRVLDVHGRIVHEQLVAPEAIAATQDLTALAAGTYIVIALDKVGMRVATARLVRR